MFKFKGPWDGKKTPLLYSLPSNAQLVSNLERSTKALLWKGTGMIVFFGWMPKTGYPGCQRLVASAFGQHRKFPLHARKTSGTQGKNRRAEATLLFSNYFYWPIPRASVTSHSNGWVLCVASADYRETPSRRELGFCTLCFCVPTKMLYLNAPFFPLKCSVSPKKSLKCSDNAHYWQTFFLINFKVYTYKNVQVLQVTTTTCTSS